MRQFTSICRLCIVLCTALIFAPAEVRASSPTSQAVLTLPKSSFEFYDRAFHYWWISPTDLLILRGVKRPERYSQPAQAWETLYRWKASRLSITSGKETLLPRLTRLLQRNADFFKVHAAGTSANVNSPDLLWINSTEHFGRQSIDRYYTYDACTACISGSDFARYSVETHRGFHYAIPQPSGWLPTSHGWYQYSLCFPSDPVTHRTLYGDTARSVQREQIEFAVRPVGKQKSPERRLWIYFMNHTPGRLLCLLVPTASNKMFVVCGIGDNVKDVRLIGLSLDALRGGEQDALTADYGFFPYDDAAEPSDIALSPTADRLAWVSEDGRIWTLPLPNSHSDFSTKKLVWTRKNAPPQIEASQLAWSPDSKSLSFIEGGHLWVIDVNHFLTPRTAVPSTRPSPQTIPSQPSRP